MAHEILSVKLCQLDDCMEKLHSRIRMSETEDCIRLQRELTILEQECSETEYALREKLQRSKSALTAVLSQSCRQLEEIIRQTDEQLQTIIRSSPDEETAVEGRLLLAEYALDFAHLAASRALLVSMKAIDTQLLAQQKERSFP